MKQLVVFIYAMTCEPCKMNFVEIVAKVDRQIYWTKLFNLFFNIFLNDAKQITNKPVSSTVLFLLHSFLLLFSGQLQLNSA